MDEIKEGTKVTVTIDCVVESVHRDHYLVQTSANDHILAPKDSCKIV